MAYPKILQWIESKLDKSEVVTTPTANKILKLNGDGDLPTDITGNSNTVGGKELSKTGKRWGVVPYVDASGIIEVGKYTDFHNNSADTTDKLNRITSVEKNKLLLNNFLIWTSGNGGYGSGMDADKLNGQRASELSPIGQVAFFATKNPPTGWLKANGATISRKAYADLFTVIGTTFGKGDGSTTFKLPDLRGEFIRGWDDGRNVDKNRVFGSLQTDDFKTHKHLQMVANAFNIQIGNSTGVYGMTGGSYGGSNTYGGAFQSTGEVGGKETRPRNVALLACIKYSGIVQASEIVNQSKFNIYMTANIQDWGVETSSGVNNCVIGTIGKSKYLDMFVMNITGIDFTYSIHSQDVGDTEIVEEGSYMGISGKRIEGITINVTKIPTGYQLQYRCYVQDSGWTSWATSGNFCGTKGLSKRVESIECRVVKL